MTHADDAVTPTRAIAARMKELRKRHDWSAQRLADEMKRVGVSWDRSVVANLENGRRSSVSVEEMLALAYVLDVAPLNLAVPLDPDMRYQATPTASTRASVVRAWIRGDIPLTGQDPRMFFSEVPGWQSSNDSAEEIAALERLLEAKRAGTTQESDDAS